MSPSDIKEYAEVVKKGEALYFGGLKEKYQKENGKYLAINVDSGICIINTNRLELITEAQREFGGKKFYVVQIGDLEEPTVNFRERKNVAWLFSE